jgi:glycosyltransferase involved in cell wall biosynthesis
MRIGIVSETYPPEVNGVALTVSSLANGLARRGHSVQVVRPRHPLRAPDSDGAGIESIEVQGVSMPRYSGLRFGLPAGRALGASWREQRPDAIYVATEGPLGHSAVGAAKRLGIPVATGFHTRFDAYASHYGMGVLAPLVRAYLGRFHRRASATLVPTRALADELHGMGVVHAQVLRRAVDTQRFHPSHRSEPLRASWQADAETPVMLYVGRIAPEKNLDLAVAAFRGLQRRMPTARYVWVGDGPARAELQARNPDFIFAGTLRGDELAAHYASADLFVFPSLSETFGNVVLESLAAGVPVVAYDEGAARDYIDNGSNGIRIAVGNETGFVERSAALGADLARRRAMGVTAHHSTADLAPESVILDFEQLLHRLTVEHVHERHAAIAARA